MATLSNIRKESIEDTGFSSGLDSSQVTTIASSVGLSVYSTVNDLPSSGLASGDQAFVSSTNRFYISNGSGWYNVALINATPSLTIDPTGTIVLATDGSTPTVITLTATDSDNPVAGLAYTVESDGNFGGLATISQDSSVFTITPLGEDSATTASASLTFKASDGISFGSGTRTLTLSFTVQYSNYTALLAKADTAGTDNQVDASTNTHTITENGNVTSTALSPYHPGGYSTYFDGSAANIVIADDASLDVGTGDFTIEAWIYLTSDDGSWAISSHAANGGMWFGRYSAGLVFRRYSVADVITATPPSINTWHHIAVARSSGQTRMFVNGTQVGTTATDSTDYSVAASLYIGDDGNALIGGAQMMTGYIRDFRLVKGTGLYTANFTPPTEPLTAIANTSVLACHLPYIADGSSNNHTLTVNGNISTKRFAPYDYEAYTKTAYGGSVYFDGVGDYFHTDLGANGGPDGDFTIEFWVYNESGTANGGFFHMSATAGGFSSSSNDALALGKTTYYNFYYGTGNTATGSFSGRLGWQHFAMVRSGSTITLYHHGKVITTQSESGDFSSYRYIAIGGYYSASYLHTGYIADFRYVKGTAVYTSAFTPPTAPLTAITNTKLLTSTNKNDIWDTGSGRLITKGGNTTASNTQRKFATSSAMYFDGTGDYIALSPSSTLAPEAGSFTIEFWMYATSITGTQNIYDTRTGNGFTVNMASGVLGFYSEPNSGYLLQSSTLSVNTWYHVAIVRNATAMAMYINGTSVATATNSSSFTNTAGTIGARYSQDQQYYFGYLQDLRVTKGFARYTSAFTPPTAEFTA